MTVALVTGANGHIGSNLVRSLRSTGWTPIAFVRPGSDRRGLAGLDLELREGDVCDADAVRRAMAGVDVVFHVAAPHRSWAPDPSEIRGPAVEGTRVVIAAAAGRRVVCTSTGATVGFTDDPTRPLTETSFVQDPAAVYITAKVAAERVALDAAAAGADVVVVNPSGVFGPLDYRLTPATRALIGLLQGDPAFIGICATDVRDVAAGHVLAAQRGVSGHRYLLTGEGLLPGDVARLYAETSGIRPMVFGPPRFVLRLMAWWGERSAARTGVSPAITSAEVADVYGRHLLYDASRARTELGWTCRPAAEVFVDAFRWLLFVGALKPKVAAKVAAHLGERATPDPDWS